MAGPDRVTMIKERLEKALSTTRIAVVDESHLHAGHAGTKSGGGHFSVTIVSDKFTGQSMIQRHRMVYLAVDDLMRTEIHALSIKALTPEEV
ncbi:MAG: BolA family transcriptional regulator [Gammaproteobacteria bacterium]|nr:BolA family transcriptional regulator [Gammaproteobacteria bacterium]